MRAAILILTVLATGCSGLRSEPATGPAPGGEAAEVRRGGGPGGGDAAAKPYDQVITGEAITRDGLFKTHLIGEKLYYEIPEEELGKDMLLVTQIARNTLGEGYGGQAVGNRVLRWERRGDQILLRSVSFELMADSTLPIYQAVEAANYDPVVASFDIESWGPDSAPVVEVTSLYTTDSPEFGVGRALTGNLDRERSFVERVASFPENVEVEATQTYTVRPDRVPGLPDRFQPAPRTASILMHWSMVRLPEEPMMPRLHDSRVGYFSVEKQDFGTEEHRVAKRRFITRWRLECADGETTPCEPVKPITYYVDPATPEVWRPYVREGIEDWQRAFEEAGFIRAIVAADAPSAEEDPDWSPEDARYSVVRWLPSTIENAQGPHVHDPRSGEILESDIKMYHNVLNLLRDWYFVQVAPLDPRAQTLPLPDSLMGRLLRYVVAHEVGHTLGFPHNQKASSTYDADSVRNPEFLRRMGHTPTLMDYSRFNYVAQPEDQIPVELLVPDIGPYDKFATMWGYKPIPGANTPEEELGTLDVWAREQDEKPYLRFNTPGTAGADPGDHTEAVGDADAVRSTELGIRNIRRIVPMLRPATVRPGESYDDLEELYERLIGQWGRELAHVVTIVGGVESQEKRGGQAGVRFEPLRRERQKDALRFLNQAAFQTPDYFLDEEILRRIEVDGAIDRVGTAQRRLIAGLLDNGRMQRMIEFEALANGSAAVYPLGEMLTDLRRGVWSEVYTGPVRADAFRRNLQREYLAEVDSKLNPPERSQQNPLAAMFGQRSVDVPSDAQALLRGELQDLDRAIAGAIPRAADRNTRLHLQDARARIDRLLDPRS